MGSNLELGIYDMIINETNLEVADNSGARRVQCIKVIGGSKRRFASVGDVIIVSIKEAIPKGKVNKGDVHQAVIVSFWFYYIKILLFYCFCSYYDEIKGRRKCEKKYNLH